MAVPHEHSTFVEGQDRSGAFFWTLHTVAMLPHLGMVNSETVGMEEELYGPIC